MDILLTCAMKNEMQFPIKAVVNKTGLSPHVIRIWERRYHAVTPKRTATNRRVYSEADVERLMCLQSAITAGHSIGQIAQLPLEKLRALAQRNEPHLVPSVRAMASTPAVLSANTPPELGAHAYLENCLAAVQRFDAATLEAILARANVALGPLQMIDRVILPFVNRVGEMWHEGTLRVMHEHLATSAIRTFCTNLKGPQDLPATAPAIVVTTPTGQAHELGALIVALVARHHGWNAIYLGPNLPAEEIAAAAEVSQARVVALSIIYPADDPALPLELQRLRNYMRAEVALIVGGRSAGGYAKVLNEIGAITLHDAAEFRRTLDALRVYAKPAAVSSQALREPSVAASG